MKKYKIKGNIYVKDTRGYRNSTRKVLCLDENGDIVDLYASQNEAAEANNMAQGTVSKYCSSGHRYINGRTFINVIKKGEL